jgi:hypothetical protein
MRLPSHCRAPAPPYGSVLSRKIQLDTEPFWVSVDPLILSFSCETVQKPSWFQSVGVLLMALVLLD